MGRYHQRRMGLCRLGLSVFLTIVACSCSEFRRVTINDVLSHPRDYDSKMVTISGEVKESMNVMVLKYYVVRDETGQIVVVTERAVPKPGDRVRVTGVVNQAFSIAGRDVVVIKESER